MIRNIREMEEHYDSIKRSMIFLLDHDPGAVLRLLMLTTELVAQSGSFLDEETYLSAMGG